jgi:hypothetical protein
LSIASAGRLQALFFAARFAQKQVMTDDAERSGTFKRLARWAVTPPQAYGVYLTAVVLVFLLSFYAGTMKPRKVPEGGPPTVAAPRS